MKRVLRMLPFLLGGILAGGAMGWCVASRAESITDLLLAFAFLFAAYWAQIILHEAGHLLAGLLTGYRFVSFRIGSLMLIKQGGRLRFARFSLAGTGGQCLLAPPPLQGTRYPCVLYHLGGSLMNLLCAALAGLALYFAGYHPWRLGTLVAALTMALTNGIPMRLGTVDNDGRNALRSLREEPVRMGFYRQLQINAALAEGQRLGEMPEAWFDCAPGQERECGYTRFQWMLDKGEYQRARDYGQTLLNAGLLGLHRALLENDLRSLALLSGETPEEPSRELRQVMKAMAANPAILRGRYVFARLQDGGQQAEALRERFHRAVRAYPYPSDVQADIDLMRLADEISDHTSAPADEYRKKD